MKKVLKRKRKGYFVLCILLILIIAFFTVNSEYLHLSKEDKKFVNEALAADWLRVKFEYLIRDDDEKKCAYILKMSSTLYAPEKYNEIRCNLNNFLKENSSHYLNNNYKIEIVFTSIGSAPPIGVFQNYFEVKWLGIEEHYSGFYHFESYNLTNKLNNISKLTVFNDLISLKSEGSFYGEDLSNIKNIPTLKYIQDEALTDEDQRQINQWLPNCMIISE